jgi:putative membrane protein
VRRLHPFTILVLLLPKLLEAVKVSIPFLIGSVASHNAGNSEWVGVLIGVLTGLFTIGSYWTTRFGIHTDHVSHQSGWIFKKDRRIPLNQIQNVNLRQNLLERVLRVATVDVETAMGRGHDLKLTVLGLSDAERFREELLEATHLGVAPSQAAKEPLITLSRHDLILGAVTENHFKDALAALAILSGPVINVGTRLASRLSPALAPVVACVTVALLGIGGWLWGAVSYYLKYGDFTVRRDPKLFRISYGITNRVQTVIRAERIEYLRLVATLPQRWLGRASLYVGTASTFGDAAVLAPVALYTQRSRAEEGASEVIAGLDVANLSWRPFAPNFYRAAVIRSAILLAALGLMANFSAAWKDGPGPIASWVLFAAIGLLLVMPVIVLFLSRPENGFAISDNALVVRRGYFHQKVSAMPIDRMETILVERPIWWKRFHASRLLVQAMKQKILVPAIPDSAIVELEQNWLGRIGSGATLDFYRIRDGDESANDLVLS